MKPNPRADRALPAPAYSYLSVSHYELTSLSLSLPLKMAATNEGGKTKLCPFFMFLVRRDGPGYSGEDDEPLSDA